MLKLQLDAQVRIEIAKAQAALGSALASMNIKLIGDPNAAASLLRLVTLADGIGGGDQGRADRCGRSASS
ncbi:MAG: hypothetical protein IPM84_20020 [Anaerolineae bacterium]|nr:hypothetical protein [Anaerolineae bacterium]